MARTAKTKTAKKVEKEEKEVKLPESGKVTIVNLLLKNKKTNVEGITYSFDEEGKCEMEVSAAEYFLKVPSCKVDGVEEVAGDTDDLAPSDDSTSTDGPAPSDDSTSTDGPAPSDEGSEKDSEGASE